MLQELAVEDGSESKHIQPFLLDICKQARMAHSKRGSTASVASKRRAENLSQMPPPVRGKCYSTRKMIKCYRRAYSKRIYVPASLFSVWLRRKNTQVSQKFRSQIECQVGSGKTPSLIREPPPISQRQIQTSSVLLLRMKQVAPLRSTTTILLVVTRGRQAKISFYAIRTHSASRRSV